LDFSIQAVKVVTETTVSSLWLYITEGGSQLWPDFSSWAFAQSSTDIFEQRTELCQ